MVGAWAKSACRPLIAIRTVRDLVGASSEHRPKKRLTRIWAEARAVGNPKLGVGDSFPRSPAKARRPSGIDPADHYLPR